MYRSKVMHAFVRRCAEYPTRAAQVYIFHVNCGYRGSTLCRSCP